MEQSEIERTVRDIFALVLKRPIAAGEDITRQDEPKWDSLKHVELIFAVEEKFDLLFSEEDMAKMDRLSDLVKRISAHHAA
jgi:acyl carrier protein